MEYAFLQRLNVGEDADDRAIRRAYARELKLIDQEADPAGFQDLREAYETALDWQRHHAARQATEARPATDSAGAGTETPPASPDDTLAATLADTHASPLPATAHTARSDQGAETQAGLADQATATAPPPAATGARADTAVGGAPDPGTVLDADTTADSLPPHAFTAPAAPADEHAEPQPHRPVTEHAAAGAVFEQFLRRAEALVEARAISSDAPWRHALRVCLDDERLVNIVARELFEQHVADLLAEGWRPGHDTLLEAAVKTFGWHTDRRRMQALGYAGYVLDTAIDERAMFDALADRDRQQQLIERLRDPRPPTAGELLAQTTPMAMLFSRFPTWMPLVTSAANMARWRGMEQSLPAWRRLLNRATKRAAPREGHWLFNWKWLIFVAVLSLVRMGCQDANRDDSARRHAQATGQPASAAGETATSSLNKGDTLLQNGDYDAAIASYTRAIQLDPGLSAAYSNRALASIFTGVPEAGILADLDRAAELEKTNANVPRARGLLALNDERYDEALAAFTRANELYPDHPYTLDKRAQAYEGAGQDDLALADIARRLKISQDGSVDAYRSRMRILSKQGDEAEALAQIEPMIGANKNNADAYVAAANAYRDAGQDRQAMFMLERGIAEAPDSTLYLVRARLRERADLAGRRADIDKCLAIAACAGYALEPRIELELDDGKPGAALDLLSGQIDGDKVDYAHRPVMLAYRAIVYAKMGRAKQAAAGFEAARAAAGTRHALNNLAWFLATQNTELPRALAAIDAALVNPARVPAHLDTKAMVLLRLGRYREAVAVYDEALALRPRMAFSRFGRGLAKRRAGDRAGAEADFKAARRAQPGVEGDYARMGLTP
nr:tetratricopeptide repeat protein [uncultured Duganella sp.]